MLIQAADLLAQLARGEQFLLIDVREQADWQQASLPNAVNLNVYDYFIPDCTEAGLATMAHSFQQAWRQLPQAENRIPVFFEQRVGMRSPRGAWFAWFIGCEEALILDGGLEAWVAAGGPLAPGQGASAVVSPSEIPAPALTPRQRQWVASRDEVIAAGGVQSVILDARRPSEFDGSFVHDCCHRAGRIPGAHLLFWEDVLENGAFRPAAEIAQRAEQAGLHSRQRIMIYCHRGARAATVLAALRLAGYQNLAIYVGSWHEWAEHEELGSVTGK
ncbi:sulfurtransferase [Ewingella americana]|uniref:Rhodanese family sulfurtransferase n=2 Tax=Ewingella americana TaxID=41202 RepID=A0A085G274_EWIA3|nr:rhodanese-like domain-containing protein [Ewingella americana]KAA8726877.1 sulfurtransferase [Ewingella americana]KFC77819.1 rhodanese family sulfurtransferase [Ewingella americana ATCC 33852]